MDLRLGGRVVQPDVFWVAEESACVDQGSHYAGPPDLVIEVLSPSNTENDRVTKFDLYQREGVREYWIVNPTEDYLEVYALTAGAYRRVGAFKPGMTFTSPVLAASVPAADLFDV
jgi:Uma2 family endonuclease